MTSLSSSTTRDYWRRSIRPTRFIPPSKFSERKAAQSSRERPLWQCLTVILNPHTNDVEAEQEILDFIREQRRAARWPEAAKICFYCTDSDTLLLTIHNDLRCTCVLIEDDETLRKL
jgi:5'-3' exonuclease